MSDGKDWMASGEEPFLWAFYTRAPGGSTPASVCTVRYREEADYLRRQGIEVFPLYTRPASELQPMPNFTSEKPFPHSGLSAWDTPPLQDSGDAASDRLFPPWNAPDPRVSEEHVRSSELTASASSDSALADANTLSLLVDQIDRMKEALRPFANMAELAEGKEDDETLLSLQAGPLQWRHLTAGHLRRARAILLSLGS